MQILFYILAFVATLAALGVVLLPRPLYSALCLIVNMVILAGMFAMLDAHFLAAVQIIVYAGAIMVLVVFLIMLLSVDGEEHLPIGFMMGTLGIISTGLFLYIVIPILHSRFGAADVNSIEGTVREVGLLLYTKYLFSFEVASILIMIAVVGAVMLAKNPKLLSKTRREEIQAEGSLR